MKGGVVTGIYINTQRENRDRDRQAVHAWVSLSVYGNEGFLSLNCMGPRDAGQLTTVSREKTNCLQI